MASYRDKWMDEKRAAAVAEAVAEKAKEHVALAREERAEAREERDAAQTRDPGEDARAPSAAREHGTRASREPGGHRSGAARRGAVPAGGGDGGGGARGCSRRAAAGRATPRRRGGDAAGPRVDALKENADERVPRGDHARVAAIKEAATHANIAKQAVAGAEAVALAQVELKAKTQQLIDRVAETQRHARGRADAPRGTRRTRASCAGSPRTRGGDEERGGDEGSANVGPVREDASREASTTLADAMKQCFAVRRQDADGVTLRRWLAD